MPPGERSVLGPSGIRIKHIDCWAKLLTSSDVLVIEYPEDHPQHAGLERAAV